MPYLLSESVANTEATKAQKGAIASFIEQMIRAVKAWVFDKTGITWKLSPEDIVAIAERMIKRIGNNPNPSNPTTRFSKSITQEAKDRIAKEIAIRQTSTGELNLWQRTIGSKLGIALSNPAYKNVS